MKANDVIYILSKFRHIDKYGTFYKILPSVLNTTEEQKNIVSEILNDCCSELLDFFQQAKRPKKQELKQSLIDCMDALSIAKINAENREFGYQLGWYLAEKVKIDLRKGTEKKLWGYWMIEYNEVKIPVKPRVSHKVKSNIKFQSQDAKAKTTTKDYKTTA